MAQLYLRTGIFVFGSPTTVMYRSSAVRGQQPFYEEGRLHEDTEKCMQLLQEWDFGFVHQVLALLRIGNESISSAYRTFEPELLDRYIIVQRFAPTFLEAREAATLMNHTKKVYYRMLASQALHLRERAFWEYHADGLKTIEEAIDWSYLALQVSRKVIWMALNPGGTARSVFNYCRRMVNRPMASQSDRPIRIT
jgi:hypothetical protein